MSNTWNVKLGSLWRTYKVQGGRAGPFVKQGTLAATGERLELTTKHDPPGSGWLAAVAALVTGVVVVLVAQQLGFCAGPGWLLWFIGIAMLRRRTVTLNVHEADRAIIDPANRRLAFHLNFEGKMRWVAVDVPENFEDAGQAVATQMAGRVFQDKIQRALTSGSIAMIVLAIVFAALILVSVIAAFIFMATERPRTRPATSSVITGIKACAAAVPLVLNRLPGFVRRI